MKSRQPLKIIIIVVVLLWDLQGLCNSLKIPFFVVDVPKGHFAGVSEPCESLAEARNSAIGDVTRQILGSMGSRYDHRFVVSISGDPNRPQKSLNDNLSRIASGVVFGVESNIVKSSLQMDDSGKYIYYILVRYPQSLIEKMRRLSMGSRLIAKLVGVSGGDAVIRISEVNGVSVVLTSADVKVNKRNRFANMISFLMVQVPEGSYRKYGVALDPVTVCAEFKTIRLRLNDQKAVSDYILGAKVEYDLKLNGRDELGRAVSVSVTF